MYVQTSNITFLVCFTLVKSYNIISRHLTSPMVENECTLCSVENLTARTNNSHWKRSHSVRLCSHVSCSPHYSSTCSWQPPIHSFPRACRPRHYSGETKRSPKMSRRPTAKLSGSFWPFLRLCWDYHCLKTTWKLNWNKIGTLTLDEKFNTTDASSLNDEIDEHRTHNDLQLSARSLVAVFLSEETARKLF